jgi:hypothetical protein
LGQINNSGLSQPELDLVLGANMQKLLKLTWFW